MDLLLWKNANFSMLFSLKWLVFHLQGHKTLSFGQNIQFLTNPFGRIPNVRLF